MTLSEHFDLAEFTTSQTASRKGIANVPPPEVIEHLKQTAAHLELVRALLGKPMSISSGYRSPALNKAIGGVPLSAHTLGWAADFICPAYGSPLAICKALAASSIKFDQIIEEGTWVHISFDPRMRGIVLTKTGNGYSAGLSQ